MGSSGNPASHPAKFGNYSGPKKKLAKMSHLGSPQRKVTLRPVTLVNMHKVSTLGMQTSINLTKTKTCNASGLLLDWGKGA